MKEFFKRIWNWLCEKYNDEKGKKYFYFAFGFITAIILSLIF